MKNKILKSQELTFDKSSFKVNLVQNSNKKLYVEIHQSTHEDRNSENILKINPTVISDLIRLLTEFKNEISVSPRKYVRDDVQQKIQEVYLKGIPIEHMTLQFNLSEEQIQDILKNRGIYIVTKNDLKPKTSYRYWRKK